MVIDLQSGFILADPKNSTRHNEKSLIEASKMRHKDGSGTKHKFGFFKSVSIS